MAVAMTPAKGMETGQDSGVCQAHTQAGRRERRPREERLVDRNNDGRRGQPEDFTRRHFDLGGRDDLMGALDAGDASAHQLGGAQTGDDYELERIRPTWALNHRILLPLQLVLW